MTLLGCDECALYYSFIVDAIKYIPFHFLFRRRVVGVIHTFSGNFVNHFPCTDANKSVAEQSCVTSKKTCVVDSSCFSNDKPYHFSGDNKIYIYILNLFQPEMMDLEKLTTSLRQAFSNEMDLYHLQ